MHSESTRYWRVEEILLHTRNEILKKWETPFLFVILIDVLCCFFYRDFYIFAVLFPLTNLQ